MNKIIKIMISTTFFYIFKLLPLKKNQMVFFSLDKGLSDNPRYIYEEFLKSNKYDLYWIMSNDKIRLSDKKNTNFVEWYTIKSVYILARSKVVVSNYRKPFIYRLKKSQKYIQTWHGTALKKIEKDAEHLLSKQYILDAKTDSRDCDLMISGNEYSTILLKNKFWYKGKVLNSGTPRNDLLFSKDSHLKNELRKKLDISINEKVIMYAPTFRGDSLVDLPPIDIDLLLSALNKNDKYVLILRFHPNVSKKIDIKSQFQSSNGRIIDGSFHNDMTELLFVTDILITDYSSTMFDYALTGNPCILFTYDEEKYVNNDRGVYMTLDDLPFERYKTIDDLVLGIRSFDKEKYNQKLNIFFKKIGNYEKGEAAKYIALYIEENFL